GAARHVGGFPKRSLGGDGLLSDEKCPGGYKHEGNDCRRQRDNGHVKKHRSLIREHWTDRCANKTSSLCSFCSSLRAFRRSCSKETKVAEALRHLISLSQGPRLERRSARDRPSRNPNPSTSKSNCDAFWKVTNRPNRSRLFHR